MLTLLREGFVNSWVLAKELPEIAKRDGSPEIEQLCARIQENYAYPVDSVLIAPDLRVLGHINVNEVYGASPYVQFLQRGLAAAKRPAIPLPAQARSDDNKPPRVLKLTPERPSTELLEVLTVHGFGKSSFRYQPIDASAFPNGGVLEIEVRLGDAPLGAKFELCAPIETAPTGDDTGMLQSTGPVQQQALASGGRGTLTHTFRSGAHLALAVRPVLGNAGDTNAWFATIRVRPR